MAPERPSQYRSRYLLYKKGSQQVVTWLHETASGLGPTKSLDELSVDDLPSLAATVSNARIKLPPSIASVLSDVIYLRQQAHEWYSSLTRDDGAAGNGRIGAINTSHRFFIDVLKGLKIALDPIGAKATEDGRKQQEPSFSHMSNMFSGLNLEEPSDSPLGDAASPDSSDNTAIVETPEDERPFAVWCLFKDIHDVRLYVRQFWQRYHKGELTFPTAAYLTEVAFRVVSDIIAANPDKSLRRYSVIVQALEFKSFQASGGLAGFSSTNNEGTRGMDAEEAVEMFCVPGGLILFDYMTSCQADREICPYRSEAEYHRIHPLGPALRGLRDQLQLLAENFSERGQIGPLRVDHFTYHLLNISKRPQQGPALTVAVVQCQMYMEIYDALGSQPTVVTSTLPPAATSVIESLSEYLQTWNRFPEFQALMKKRSEHLLELANISLEDRFTDPEVPEACRPSSIFAVLPVLAGAHLYELLRQRSTFSVRCANLNFATTGTAYLYSALEDTPNWATMARLLEQHRNYVPQASSLDKHTRSFERAIGAKTAIHRRKAGQGLPDSVDGAQTPLTLTYHTRAIKLNLEKMQENG